MTNAQETNVKQEPLSEQAFLDTLINLCDDLAWGRPASEDRLFALTKEGAGPKNYVRLAEAFGMMLVKVESREYHRSQLIADLKTRNAELEEAHRLLAERNTHLMRTIQENYQTAPSIHLSSAPPGLGKKSSPRRSISTRPGAKGRS